MGKFDGVLLATDFDDTLYRSNITGPGVSEAEKRSEIVVFGRNKEALDYFLAEGGRFTVATGRAFQTFRPYVGRVPMNAPCILGNGAVIYDFEKDTELSHAWLPETILEDAQALSEAMPELGFETHLGEIIYTYRPNEITWRHLHKMGCPYVECAFEEMPRPWTKLLVQHVNHGELVKAQTWVKTNCPGRYEAIFSNYHLLEITAAGANKGGAVLKVAVMLGIEPENIYCIGDNQNDIPMLAVAKKGFAPANCAAEVREWGAEILSPCDEGAVADVIRWLDRHYE